MKRAIYSGLIAAALMIALISIPVWAQISNFDSIIASGDVTAGDDITSGDDVISTDDVTVGDDIVIGGLERLTAATAISVTTDGTVTPTGSYQPLESAGTVATSDITVLTAGTIVHLVNTTNTSITFTDTATLKLSGNAALGQYDTLTILSDGTNWIEVGQVNN